MIDVLERNNVRVIGSGEQTLVFAHGFSCDQNVWRHLIKAFQHDYRCVVFDYVGAGASDKGAYNLVKYQSLDGYVQDLLDVFEALGLTNGIFVGHSVSCMIGVRAALLRPYYFSKLIFVTPSPSYINDGDYRGGMEKDDLVDLLAIMDSNYLGWSRMIAPMVMGNADKPELTEELTTTFCSNDPTIAREFARVTFLSDSRADLEKLSVASLTLQCTDDMLVPPAVAQYIQERTENNSLIVLKATGHCPHLSAPDETVQAIRSYMSVR